MVRVSELVVTLQSMNSILQQPLFRPFLSYTSFTPCIHTLNSDTSFFHTYTHPSASPLHIATCFLSLIYFFLSSHFFICFFVALHCCFVWLVGSRRCPMLVHVITKKPSYGSPGAFTHLSSPIIPNNQSINQSISQ